MSDELPFTPEVSRKAGQQSQAEDKDVAEDKPQTVRESEKGTRAQPKAELEIKVEEGPGTGGKAGTVDESKIEKQPEAACSSKTEGQSQVGIQPKAEKEQVAHVAGGSKYKKKHWKTGQRCQK